MPFGILATILLFSAATSIASATSIVHSCSMPFREVAECFTAEGDVFTYYGQPACLHEKLQDGNSPTVTRIVKKTVEGTSTKFFFKSGIVVLPKDVVDQVVRISLGSYRNQENLWEGIEDKVERNNQMVAAFAKDREKTVSGAKLYEIDSKGMVVAEKPLSCQMPASHF